MRKQRILFGYFLFAAMMLWAFPTFAVSMKSVSTFPGTAVGVKFGTGGFGVELVQGAKNTINFRLGLNGYHLDDDLNRHQVDYDIAVKLYTWSLFGDWYPYNGEFRVTGGFLYNGNTARVRGTPSVPKKIGDTRYSPSEIGTITYNVDFNNIAPYLGIGVGNAIGKDRKFSFVFDCGIVLQGSPDAHISANGHAALDSEFQYDLKHEEHDLQDDMRPFKYYPVLSFGVTYRFR